MPRLCRRVTDG